MRVRNDRSTQTAPETPTDTRTETPRETPAGTPDRSTGTPTTDCPPTETPSGGASLAIRNRLDEVREENVSIERTDGEVVFEASFELAAGDGTLESDAIAEEGEYEIELAVEAGATERRTVSLPDENRMPLGAYTVTIYLDEEIELGGIHADPAPGC